MPKYLSIVENRTDGYCYSALTVTPKDVKFEDFTLTRPHGFFIGDEKDEVLCWFRVSESVVNFEKSKHRVSLFDKYHSWSPFDKYYESDLFMKILVGFSFSPLKNAECVTYTDVFHWNDGKLDRYNNQDYMAVGNFCTFTTCKQLGKDFYVFTCSGEEG